MLLYFNIVRTRLLYEQIPFINGESLVVLAVLVVEGLIAIKQAPPGEEGGGGGREREGGREGGREEGREVL